MKRKNALIFILSLNLLTASFLIPSQPIPQEDKLIIEIPGGIDLLSKILGINNVSIGKDFIWLLINYLCRDFLILNQADKDIKRENFASYLNFMNKITGLMQKTSTGYYIQLNLEENEELAKKIFDLFGYDLRKEETKYNLIENQNKDNWLKHLSLLLLGYHPETILKNLNESKKMSIFIPAEYIELPFSKRLIKSILPTEKDLEKNFLNIIAKNIDFDFLFLSLYNLSDETIEAINKSIDNEKISAWRLLLYSSENAGWKFYRISPYIEANSSTISTPIDRKLIKGPSGIYFNELSFIKNWMNNSDGKFAYFMRGLYSSNPIIRNILINNESEDIAKSINLLYFNLNLPRRERLSQLYDLKELEGFPEVLSTLRYKENDIYFPGGYDSWIKAIKNHNIPKSYEDLLKENNSSSLSYLEFFKELAKWKTNINGQDTDGMPVFFRTYNFFIQKEELATPENILILFRAYPYYPSIITYLEHINFNDPTLLYKVIFKIIELENLEDDDYENAMRIFQSNLSLFWILSLNPQLGQKDINYLFKSFLELPFDNKYGFDFKYARWFYHIFLKYLNCNENNPGECMLDAIGASIPQDHLRINEAIYLFNPREREKEQIKNILKEQKIPSLQWISNIYQIILKIDSMDNKEKIRDCINELQNQLSSYISEQAAEEMTHPIIQEMLRMLKLIEKFSSSEEAPKELILKISNIVNELIGWHNLGLVYSFWMKNVNSKAFSDNSFIAKHDFSKLKNTILIKTPWRNTHLVIQDPKKGVFLQGSLSMLPLELAPLILQSEFASANSKLLNDELPKWLWASAIFPKANLIDDQTNSAIASFYELGIELIKDINNSIHPESKQILLSFLKEHIGKARYIKIHDCLLTKANCQNTINLFTPSELFYLGKFSIDNSIELTSERYKKLKILIEKNPEIQDKINQFGTIAPHILGSSIITINYLPSYENLEKYYTHSPIAERLFDYKIRTAYLIDKLQLPAKLQYLIWQKAVLYILSHCRQNYIDDWESIVWQTQLINEETLIRWIQEFKAQGYLELE